MVPRDVVQNAIEPFDAIGERSIKIEDPQALLAHDFRPYGPLRSGNLMCQLQRSDRWPRIIKPFINVTESARI